MIKRKRRKETKKTGREKGQKKNGRQEEANCTDRATGKDRVVLSPLGDTTRVDLLQGAHLFLAPRDGERAFIVVQLETEPVTRDQRSGGATP